MTQFCRIKGRPVEITHTNSGFVYSMPLSTGRYENGHFRTFREAYIDAKETIEVCHLSI